MQIPRPQGDFKVDLLLILRSYSDLMVGVPGTLSKRPGEQVSKEVHELVDQSSSHAGPIR